MLKVRLMGTKEDIEWYKSLLQKNTRINLLEFSDCYSNKGTDRFFRAYAEIEKRRLKIMEMLSEEQLNKEFKELTESVNHIEHMLEDIVRKMDSRLSFENSSEQKMLLTVKEVSKYTGLGVAKIYELSNVPHCPFVVYVGKRRLIKRKAFEEFVYKNRVI